MIKVLLKQIPGVGALVGLPWLKIIALSAAALFGAVAFSPYPYLKGVAAGKMEMRSAALIEASKRNQRMEQRNADFNNLTDRGRCRMFMDDSGLPAENCDH